MYVSYKLLIAKRLNYLNAAHYYKVNSAILLAPFPPGFRISYNSQHINCMSIDFWHIIAKISENP